MSLGLPFTHTEPVALVDLEMRDDLITFWQRYFATLYVFFCHQHRSVGSKRQRAARVLKTCVCFAASAESFRLSREISLSQ